MIRTPLRSGLLPILTTLILLAAALPARAGSVDVVIAGATDRVESFSRDDITYISFSELAEIIGGTVDWKTVGHLVTYTEGQSRFEFLLGSPYVKLDDTVYNVTFPAELRDGQLFLPAETFLPLLDRVLQQKITWDSRRSEIRVDSELFNVTDLAVTAKANGLLIEIFLSKALN